MKHDYGDGVLTICLEERIDFNSALTMEKEVMGVVGEHPGAKLVLDCEKLEYISSAGLRVLMKLRKQAGKALPVINVSSEVYDIFEVTGFTDILDVQKRLRKISIEGCEKLGEGNIGTIYRLDEDKIVKVYRPWMKLEDIDRERSYARTAFVNGIPSVIAYDTVKVGDCLGVVFELLHSDTLGHAIRDNPGKMEEYMDQFVALAKSLHSTHVPEGSFTHVQEEMHYKTDRLAQWCAPEELALLHSLIDSIPDADTLTHNDLHPGNVMIQNGELVLIDMPEVTMGPPICDLAVIYRNMISGPQNRPDAIESVMGMPPDMMQKAGDLFFMKYTGVTDPAVLAEYYKKLDLLCAVSLTLIPAGGSEWALKTAPMMMDRHLRGVVIPNAQTIREILKAL